MLDFSFITIVKFYQDEDINPPFNPFNKNINKGRCENIGKN